MTGPVIGLGGARRRGGCAGGGIARVDDAIGRGTLPGLRCRTTMGLA